MKIRFLSFALICALGALWRLQAEEPSKAPKAAETAKAQPAKAKDHTELEGHMEEMGRAFRRVSRFAKDPSKNAETLQALAVVREHAEAALKLEPAMKADIPAERQEKFVADYRAHMKSFIEQLGALEAALKAGNNAEAETIVGSMKKEQKSGHDRFKRKDEKKS